MATSEPCEITEPETDREGLCTDKTRERSSDDTDKMNATSDTLTLARRDRESQEVDTVNSKLTIDSEDNTSDTLTLARLDRENQGPWECEYSYGGEADLHRHLTDCKKNPGHKNFIPVDKFSIEDLPEDYRDQEVVDYIRTVSDTTVRVSVGYVSKRRPETVPCTNKPYPGYSVRGQRKVTVGTGWVKSVKVCTSYLGHYCRCKDCWSSSTPKMHFGIIQVLTSTHLVFDDLEGKHTTCHLFFDRGGTPETCSDVVALTGMSVFGNYVTADWCLMSHYTHDLDLVRKLQQTRQLMDRLEESLIKDNKLHWRLVKQNKDDLDKQPFLFVVSHPHGCSKQISLGYVTSAHMFNNDFMSMFYNTATCPGSSGARVPAFYNFTSQGFRDVIIYKFDACHCGASDEANYCHNERGLAPFDLIDLERLDLTTGPWEDNFCSVKEGDETQHYASCKKNPGHENFFPVEKFSVDHLPSFYRRDDIMKLVKLLSDLPVRVKVKYVSENRPETVPGTDIPYPWFSNRGSQLTRLGTGFIQSVKMFDEVGCVCKECRNSAKPKSPLAFIRIVTAAHLVNDKREAIHTTCDLFYDQGETTDMCTSVVTLADVYTLKTYTTLDETAVLYFTHDMDLVRRLDNILSQYSHTLRNIENFMSTKIKQNSVDNAEQESPLHIVVSHPHGCAKQISICCCENPKTDNADTEDSKCSHSSAVCAGSSGAYMIYPSLKLVYPCVE